MEGDMQILKKEISKKKIKGSLEIFNEKRRGTEERENVKKKKK